MTGVQTCALSDLTINILWQIWKARNNREFNHKEKEPFKIIEKALKEWTEFEEANKRKDDGKSTLETEEQQMTDQEQMECHTGLLLKIHTYQSKDQPTVGIGISVTDYMGQLQAVWALTERTSGDLLQDQAAAVRLALLKAGNQGWSNIQVELDNRKLVEAIKKPSHNNHLMATLLEDIRSICNLFHQCSFSFAISRKVECIKLSLHALNIWIDEGWVNPNLRC